MKADTSLFLQHTDGDTYPIVVNLQLNTDNGHVLVSDSAIVKLHIQSDPVVILVGSSLGNGTFEFPGDPIPDLGTDTFECEIEVNDGTYVYTIARGRISIFSQVA